MWRSILILPAAALPLGVSMANAADLDGIRGPAPLTAASAPPPVSGEDTAPDRRPRSFYDQPPVIPHSIDGYRIDAGTNKCLSCHGRAPTTDASAPTISIAHLLGGNGQVSTSVAPSHYFCTECHVPQTAAQPVISNNYQILTTVPFRRYLCMECHRPQAGLVSQPAVTSRDGNEHPR